MHFIFSTHCITVPHNGHELLCAAIIAQAAFDVTDKSISQYHRHTARMLLDSRGITDEQLPAIKKAFMAYRRYIEVQR